MAMNKKEKAHVEELQRALNLAVVLRWTTEVLPDIPVPTRWDELIPGYTFHAYGNRVEVSCSSAGSHSKGNNTKTTTQNGIRQYSTRLRALRGMRWAVEQECARRLLDIDDQIKEELTKEK